MSSEEKMPLTGHLEELRKRILASVLSVMGGFALCFYFSQEILRFITRPLGQKLVFLSPAEAFWANMKVGFFAGLFLTIPIILYEVWSFISPGLHRSERRLGIPFTIMAALFFYGGVLFCTYLVLPFALDFLMTYKTSDFTATISVGLYTDFCIKFILAFGLIFELPLAITMLSRMGVITPEFLSKNRKYAVLIAFVIAAILTPTPDIFNQLLMAGPIMVLYEIGILAARLMGRRSRKENEEEADENEDDRADD